MRPLRGYGILGLGGDSGLVIATGWVRRRSPAAPGGVPHRHPPSMELPLKGLPTGRGRSPGVGVCSLELPQLAPFRWHQPGTQRVAGRTRT